MKEIEIPEGYEARIESNKVILERKESEDEKMLDIITEALATNAAQEVIEKYGINAIDCVEWLEKKKRNQATTETMVLGGINNAAKQDKALSEWSEDERIRKFLVKHVSEWIGCIEHDLKISSKDVESEEELAMFKAGLAYLEKQKEQKAIEGVIKNITKNKEAATKFLKSAGIMDENGELAEMYRSEQEPTEWSEDDVEKLSTVISLMKSNRAVDPFYDKMCLEGWLKSLPKRLHLQPKQGWSETDKQMLENIIEVIGETCLGNYTASFITKMLSWLKSLRPQPHWKPSEEQMRNLRCVISGCSYDIEPLIELENNLQKL